MKLSQDLLERVLLRLGVSATPSIDHPGLSALYRAWCERVPFDNVRKRLALSRAEPGPLPGSQPNDFFESWLLHGTGGTCWPASEALHALVTTLGFRAERVIATMLASPNAPPTHGSVAVHLDGDAHLLDVAMLSRVPIPLRASDEPLAEHPAARLRRTILDDGRFAVHWQPLHAASTIPCRVESVGASAEMFLQAYERSRVWSPFNYAISARLNRADHVIGLGLGRRAVLSERGLETGELLTRDERTRMLVDELGISEELAVALPADEPLPRPPWA